MCWLYILCVHILLHFSASTVYIHAPGPNQDETQSFPPKLTPSILVGPSVPHFPVFPLSRIVQCFPKEQYKISVEIFYSKKGKLKEDWVEYDSNSKLLQHLELRHLENNYLATKTRRNTQNQGANKKATNHGETEDNTKKRVKQSGMLTLAFKRWT